MYKIVFFGTPQFAVPSLEALAHAREIEILAVVSQPDQPKGRSLKMTPSPIAECGALLGFPVVKSQSFDEVEKFRQYHEADFFVVVAYGVIIPENILAIPKRGTLNVHPSLLPRYRGAAPIQASLLAGDHETGVSIMVLDKEMDHGPILWQEPVPIERHDTAESLSARLAGVGAKLLVRTIPLYVQKKITPQPQNHVHATYTKFIKKSDGKIDWQKPAEEIERMVRAYTPWPCAWADYERNGAVAPLKLMRVAVYKQPIALQPGQMKRDGSTLVVGCGAESALALEKVQPAGKAPMAGSSFINGYKGVDRLI